MAFIPVKNQGFVVNHAIVSRPIWTSVLDTMRRKRTAIYEDPKPIFQLRSQLPRISPHDLSAHIEVSRDMTMNPMNKTFKGQLYVAPYSLLWHCADNNVMVRSNTDVSANLSNFELATAVVKNTLSLFRGRTICTNFSDLDYLDNPAVEALIQYKW
jgi:hypothetical protein